MNIYEIEVSKLERNGSKINFEHFKCEVYAESEEEVFQIILEEEGESAKVESIKLIEENVE